MAKKSKAKSKDEKLDDILVRLSRIESSLRRLSKQHDSVAAELKKVLSAFKLQSRAAHKEKSAVKPVALRSVVTKAPDVTA